MSSLNCRLFSNESKAKINYDQIEYKKATLKLKKPSCCKSMKINKNISLPSIRSFQILDQNGNSYNDNKPNGNSNNFQCIINKSKSSTYVLDYDNRSRNNKFLTTVQPNHSSSSQTLIQRRSNKPKPSTDFTIEGFKKPKKVKTKFRLMFDKIFKIDDKLLSKINRLKSNKRIAMKNDFDLPSYQNKLLAIAAVNTSSENLRQLTEDFISLNELINSKFVIKKTKWQLLAKRISSIAPENLIIKLNSLQSKGKRPNLLFNNE